VQRARDSHTDYFIDVSLIPLYGHESLRERLSAQVERGALPASLLLHGPSGVGKQRLALWLAQRLLCTDATAPCGECQHCRYVLGLQHPDLHWIFPHERVAGSEEWEYDDLKELQDARVAERAEEHGLYARPDGSCGIYKGDTKYLRFVASRSPALAKRKVLIIGDAERMVPQQANPEAANMFLKLLEEPPADTTIILTSSEPHALLQTIRSRVVQLRVPPLPTEAVRAFLADATVATKLPNLQPAELLRLASGAPGKLLGGDDQHGSLTRARQLLAAADAGPEQRYRAAFGSGSSKARGAFTDVLDALTAVVHERARDAAARGDDVSAQRAVRMVPAIEDAKRSAEGNANPQLVTAQLLESLAGVR
jgi:DNA polymerase III subunit delta'